MLTNKYLRYRPEITLEIFTLVWDKLKSIYTESYVDKISIRFKEFQNGQNIFLNKEGEVGIYGCLDQNKLETTVQEILGYDPFVKEEFVLPEKWMIKVTLDNMTTINNWKIKQAYKFPLSEIGRVSENGGFYDFKTYKELPHGYTEITFDQFKKYVLKDNNEVTKEKVIDIKEIRTLTVELIAKGKTDKIKEALIHFKSGSISALKEEDYFEFNKMLNNIDKKPKQPLKQAVHCKTQEEWDFVTEKLGYEWTGGHWKKYGEYTCIEIGFKSYGTSDLAFKNYQILSFQEWCDLNGYKIEPNQEFKVGQWCIWKAGDKVDVFKIYNIHNSGNRIHGDNGNHYDTNNVRHATTEEINNHLIFIGQIPAGEPLNTDIEPNKDGMFKYKSTLPGSSWSGGTIQNHLDAMIPTTGNSYNKDFSTSVIPVKPISTEVEFNFLPEPK